MRLPHAPDAVDLVHRTYEGSFWHRSSGSSENRMPEEDTAIEDARHPVELACDLDQAGNGRRAVLAAQKNMHTAGSVRQHSRRPRWPRSSTQPGRHPDMRKHDHLPLTPAYPCRKLRRLELASRARLCGNACLWRNCEHGTVVHWPTFFCHAVQRAVDIDEARPRSSTVLAAFERIDGRELSGFGVKPEQCPASD